MFDQLQTSLLAVCTATALLTPGAQSLANDTGLGQPLNDEELADFDLIVSPDGSNLPPGSGTAAEGAALYAERCAACHGARGEGLLPLARLAGGDLHGEDGPEKSVGNYWPQVTTLFDFIRRAMPANAPKSLTDAQVYQATAYVLYLNGLVNEETVIDANSLPDIALPNQDGFLDFSQILE